MSCREKVDKSEWGEKNADRGGKEERGKGREGGCSGEKRGALFLLALGVNFSCYGSAQYKERPLTVVLTVSLT